MTTQTEALNIAIDYMNERLEDHDAKYKRHPATEAERINILADIETVKEALAQPEHEKERCVGCEACIDTACGRDECPKGWPKAAQPEQEPVTIAGVKEALALNSRAQFLIANVKEYINFLDHNGAYATLEMLRVQCINPLTDIACSQVTTEALAQPEHEKERCVGCEACIDTACGRDECPKGWPKAAQPEQEPVAWRELCRRLYVELFHCNAQMTYGSRPKWRAGKEVLDVLADAKTALDDAPPQRTWVGLTDEEIEKIARYWSNKMFAESATRFCIDFARAIESAHGIKE